MTLTIPYVISFILSTILTLDNSGQATARSTTDELKVDWPSNCTNEFSCDFPQGQLIMWRHSSPLWFIQLVQHLKFGIFIGNSWLDEFDIVTQVSYRTSQNTVLLHAR